MAIAEYLNEVFPAAGLLPKDPVDRAHCRSVSGEMHSGFSNLRSALPMNLKGHYPGFKVFAGAQADIDRIVTIWRDCLRKSGGPYLFGPAPCLADAMYAPVCTRFLTYDVKLDPVCCRLLPDHHGDALYERMGRGGEERPDDVSELDVEF